LRSKKRFRQVFDEHTADVDIFRTAKDHKSKNPARELINKELKSQIDRELKSLSAKQQIAFTLKYRHGLKSEEIAQIMNLNVSTVKVHIFRAANNLQKRLSTYLGGGI
jgi:RNA polymerase sigma factor (sigma-70 family)